MLLDSGQTVDDVIEELKAERDRFAPKFAFGNKGDGVAFINVFGAFK